MKYDAIIGENKNCYGELVKALASLPNYEGFAADKSWSKFVKNHVSMDFVDPLRVILRVVPRRESAEVVFPGEPSFDRIKRAVMRLEGRIAGLKLV